MSLESQYEFLVVILTAVVLLALLARKLRLPPAAALIAGGTAIAFLPGIPTLTFDPGLILVAFLPPLLLSSAYSTVWRDFKQYFAAITSLAVGAVAFTTLCVGAVVHWLLPSLPWAACFALGAIVAPPDAVAAKAVLEKLRLPTRVTAVLSGESLVNDASGLVLFHFAVAAALSGTFEAPRAIATFFSVAVGGVAIGFGLAWAGLRLLERFGNSELIVTGTVLLAAASYIVAERLGFSGVLATVTTGLLLGWQQHEIFSAATRIRAQSFWKVLVFLLESLLFVMIGLSLRGALERIETFDDGILTLAIPVTCVVVTVIVSRFIWLLGSDLIWTLLSKLGIQPKHKPSLAVTITVSWAGIRGVVSLAAALSLPIDFPGRDLILASASGVILATVIIQGTTLPLIVRLFPSLAFQNKDSVAKEEAAAWSKVAHAQYEALKTHCSQKGRDGKHPRLLEQYLYRANVSKNYHDDPIVHRPIRSEHFEAVLSAIRAGRKEVLRMYRAGQVTDKIMREIEEDLDLQELGAERKV